MPRHNKPPAYTIHRPTGQARVRIDGRDFYLGLHGTAASRAEYDRVVSEWLANGRSLARSDALTVNEFLLRYWRFAEGHYRRDGEPSRELGNIRDALRPVRRLYGHTLAAEFGPAAFKTVRAAMIEAGLARKTVNYRLGKIRRAWKWGVESELLPADAYYRLQAVAALRKGRDGVRETEPVRPVAEVAVVAVLPLVRPPIRAMVLLQLHTGCRPGEAVAITTGQVDRSGDTWVYRPRRHKADGSGRAREILIGPKGQEVLRPWLKADPDALLFVPAEDAAARQAERRAARATPLTPSQGRRRPKRDARRRPGTAYTVTAYRNAVYRACDRAGIGRWHPNQIRHAVASKVRQLHGIEAAQVILGHARADVTQVYAERDLAKARAIMREIG